MSPLGRLIADEIRLHGPIGLDRYMSLCLSHPIHGYYRTRDPLGRSGDFVTAPEISQIFGELIGVWVAAVLDAMGSSRSVILVELGPGRGTLMADALRALRKTAAGADLAVHLVETSPVLRAQQAERLAEAEVYWHERVDKLPSGPAIVIANEFFDALPIRQFERGQVGWHERRVGLGHDGSLRIGLAPEPDPQIVWPAPEGVILTLPVAGLDLVRTLARRIVEDGGALLAIDYGHARPGFGDTFQAVSGHRFVDPLDAPGEADLTAHVDFAALARAAEREGARVHGPIQQRDFLLALGLDLRADRLKRHAGLDQCDAIDAACARLIDPGRRGMGALFKALCISHPSLGQFPAFPVSA